MSPNITCDSLPSFAPRLTVAKRKQALELRKVREVFGFCFIVLNCFCLVLLFMYRMDAKKMMLSFQTMKPLMEKRRRARINDSLNHLKSLILPLTGRDVSYYIQLSI